jgi:DNA-binding NtrC family response regulator
MPQMDGVEVLKIIKQINPLIEVIMLTGYGDELLIEKAISSGAFQHIMKPVDIEMLTEKIDKANDIRNIMD